MSCPHLDTLSPSNSPHALSFFTEAKGKKKRRGTNISVETGILDMHMIPGVFSNSLKWALPVEDVMWCGLSECVCAGLHMFCFYLSHDLIDIFNTCLVMIL